MTGALRLPAVPERWPGLGRTIAPSCALLRIPAERLLDALKGLLLHVRSVVVGWRGARRALQNFVSDTLSTPPRRPASARASRSASEKRRPAEARGPSTSKARRPSAGTRAAAARSSAAISSSEKSCRSTLPASTSRPHSTGGPAPGACSATTRSVVGRGLGGVAVEGHRVDVAGGARRVGDGRPARLDGLNGARGEGHHVRVVGRAANVELQRVPDEELRPGHHREMPVVVGDGARLVGGAVTPDN